MRSPAGWLTALATVLAWPAWLVFAPIGIFLGDSPGPAYELAFMAGLLGAALAMMALTKGGWLLDQLAPTERLAAEFTALVSCGLLFEGLALTPPALLGHMSPTTLADLALRSGLTLLHLAALSLVLLRFSMPRGLHSAVLVAISWVFPALTPSTGVLVGLDPLFGASRYLARVSGSPLTPLLPLADMAAVGALLLMSRLLILPASLRQ